jgi:HlyD family secretion protein
MEAILTTEAAPAGSLRRLRRAGITLAVLAVAGAGAWKLSERWRGGAPAPAYATAPAERGDVRVQVTATGTLRPRVEVQVGSQVSGRIAELSADFNDQVTRGQVIARLDPDTLEQAVGQARARLLSAQAALTRTEAVAENARGNYQRMVGLAERGAVARAEVDSALAEQRSADAQVVAARADVTQARTAVEQAETNLGFTTITSPIDGVVVSRSVDVGQTVAASLSAPVLFVIAEDLRKMELHAAVAEADVGQLAPGMRVEFEVDAFPERTYQGVVRQVRYEAQNVSNVVTYDAVVSVDNADLSLRPGMTATAAFIVAEAEDALTVPARALAYRPADVERPQRTGERAPRPDGKRPQAVWVLRDGQPVRVRVETGLTDGALTEITGGELAPDDLIITGDAGGATARPQRPEGRGGGRRGPRPIL